MELRETGFWCVAPISVIKDRHISQSAKLLYVLITALQTETGYCYASNAYLADGIGKSEESIRRLLRELSEAGYLVVEIIRDEQNTVVERRIYPAVEPPKVEETPPVKNDQTPPVKNDQTPPVKNDQTPPVKNDRYNRVDNNILPPKAPQGGRRRREVKTEPDHKPERFARLWEYYPRAGRKSKQAAIRAWDQLKPSDELIDKMARALRRQKQSESWSKGIGIPYVATWLNNVRWEDEPDGADGPEEDSGGKAYVSGCPADWEVDGA